MLVSSELVRRAQAGDEEAFREIVSVYYRPVSGSLARLVSPVKADDLTVETSLRLSNRSIGSRVRRNLSPGAIVQQTRIVQCFDITMLQSS